MSAFQDFGPLTERRKVEKEQRRRKHLMVAGSSISVLLILAAAGVAAALYRPNSAEEPGGAKDLSITSKTIETMCSATDYKQACEKSLSNAEPKSLVRSSVSAVVDEVVKAFDQAEKLKSDDPKVKGAVDYCKVLLNDSKEELIRTLDGIDSHNLDEIAKRGYQLRNWLSAVMTYQESCIDGFPDGELKSKMQDGMKVSKQLTSNALAIIGKAASFINQFNVLGSSNRHLLVAEEEEEPAFHEDGFPWWTSESDRWHLKERAANRIKPNVVVAKDGSGDFTTISAALAALPKKYEGRYVIYVKAGLYDEHVEVTKKMVNITMYGDGSRKSIVTGNRNFVDGWMTFETATFVVEGEGFICETMGFRNTADRAIFINSRMEGYQDTLYAQSLFQFYRSCVVTGTVDFIFGDAHAIFQNCLLVVRRPMDNQQNIVTAQGRIDRYQTSGIVIHNCRIIADAKLNPVKANIRSYLGRPWKAFSRTVIMKSEIGDIIHPDGYMPWDGEFYLDTLFYAEYNNRGPGARVKWPGFRVIKKDEATRFTAASFLHAGDWLKPTRTPVRMGLYQ